MGVLPGHDFCNGHAKVATGATPPASPSKGCVAWLDLNMRQQEYQESWPGCTPGITKRAGIWQSQIYLFPFMIPSLLSSVFAPLLFLSSFSSIYFPNEFPYRFHLSLSSFFLPSILLYLVPLSCSTACSPIFLLCSPSIFPYPFPYLFPLFFSLSASCICSPFISLVFLPILLLYFPYIDPFSLLFFPYLFLCMS
jgi:hypothetical protein